MGRIVSSIKVFRRAPQVRPEPEAEPDAHAVADQLERLERWIADMEAATRAAADDLRRQAAAGRRP